MSEVSDPGLIVFFCILGSAALVVVGFAINHQFGTKTEDDEANLFRKMRDDQTEYMRQVRFQNLAWAEMEARTGGRGAMMQGNNNYATNKGLTTTVRLYSPMFVVRVETVVSMLMLML